MTAPAAIFDGSYADYKHIKTRKVLQIIVEIPAERAKDFFDMFGVPTGADEIPVAIAKMNTADASDRETEDGSNNSMLPVSTSATKPRRNPTLANHIGALCDRGSFQHFLESEYPDSWFIREQWGESKSNRAADFVRIYCGVKSRSEIIPGTEAQVKWTKLHGEYEAWLGKQS